MTSGGVHAPPTLADQVSKLYDLIAGHHATNLEETAFSRFHIILAAKP